MVQRKFHDMAAQAITNHYVLHSLWEEGSQGSKLPWATSTHKLALQLAKETNWTRKRISLASIGLQNSSCDLYTTATSSEC